MLIRDMVFGHRGFASFTSFILCLTQYNSCFHAICHSYRAFPTVMLIPTVAPAFVAAGPPILSHQSSKRLAAHWLVVPYLASSVSTVHVTKPSGL
jgi:hypothetical protein